MAQGPWDTGTWDDALWDSLPITGNAATGSPGSVGVGARTVALTGVEATGAVGDVFETDADPLVGNAATGEVGNVGYGGVTIALSGVEATGTAGNVIYVPAPIIIVDDTHDGDYHKKLKKRFSKENQRLKQKREDIVAAYERIVEGKPDLAKELTAGFEVKAKSSKNKPKELQPIDFDKFLKDIDKVEQLWAEYLEMEDEDLMVLL
jgi:hypothetical protein